MRHLRDLDEVEVLGLLAIAVSLFGFIGLVIIGLSDGCQAC